MSRREFFKFNKMLCKEDREKFKTLLRRHDAYKNIIDKIIAEINTPNRGTCDYFIVDRIEEIINEYRTESEGE